MKENKTRVAVERTENNAFCIVGIDDNGKIRPVSDDIFPASSEAETAIDKNDALERVSHDDLANEAFNRRSYITDIKKEMEKIGYDFVETDPDSLATVTFQNQLTGQKIACDGWDLAAECLKEEKEKLIQGLQKSPVTMQKCKGYAYMKNSDTPKVITGESKEDIIEKLKELNKTRREGLEYRTCNIGDYDAASGKYGNYQKYDVHTGQNISKIYLQVPKNLKKPDFQRMLQFFKENGARFNPDKKQWYISQEQKETFKNYLPKEEIQDLSSDKEQKKHESEVPPKEAEIVAAGNEIDSFTALNFVKKIECKFVVDLKNDEKMEIKDTELTEKGVKLDETFNLKAVNVIEENIKDYMHSQEYTDYLRAKQNIMLHAQEPVLDPYREIIEAVVQKEGRGHSREWTRDMYTEEVYNAHQNGLSTEQIQYMVERSAGAQADMPLFTDVVDSMRNIRHAFEQGMTTEQIEVSLGQEKCVQQVILQYLHDGGDIERARALRGADMATAHYITIEYSTNNLSAEKAAAIVQTMNDIGTAQRWMGNYRTMKPDIQTTILVEASRDENISAEAIRKIGQDYIANMDKEPSLKKSMKDSIESMRQKGQIHMEAAQEQVNAELADYDKMIPDMDHQQVQKQSIELCPGQKITLWMPEWAVSSDGFKEICGIKMLHGELVEKNQEQYFLKNGNGGIEKVSVSNVYDERQAAVMQRAVEKGFTPEKLDLIGDPRLSPAQMETILQGFNDGLNVLQVAEYANPQIDAWKMDTYRYGLGNGLSADDIKNAIDTNAAKSTGWEDSRNLLNNMIKEQRSSIIKDFQQNGVKPYKNLVEKMEKLNGLTSRKNTVKGVMSQMHDATDSEAGRLKREIGAEVHKQRSQAVKLSKAQALSTMAQIPVI